MRGIIRYSTNGEMHRHGIGDFVLYNHHEVEMKRRDAEIARLRAEVEAYRKDAERYRWLRDRAPDEWSVLLWIGSNSQLLIDDSLMDSEIDAAMGASA